MEEFRMVFGFTVWTLLTLWIWWIAFGDRKYNGVAIGFHTSSGQEIKISSVTTTTKHIRIEAGSKEVFLLRNPASDETIVGKKTPLPVGWEYPEYFKSEPVQTGPETWIVEKGSLGIKLSTSDNMEVTVMKSIRYRLATLLITSLVSAFCFTNVSGIWKF